MNSENAVKVPWGRRKPQSFRYHRIEMHLHRVLFFLLLAAAAGAGLIAGCRSLPASKPSSEWTPQEARGAAVYQAKCAKCHYATNTRSLHGPGLQALTKLKAMPSGAPPTDERLTSVTLAGRGMMPATPLNDSDMADLLAYLHTL